MGLMCVMDDEKPGVKVWREKRVSKSAVCPARARMIYELRGPKRSMKCDVYPKKQLSATPQRSTTYISCLFNGLKVHRTLQGVLLNGGQLVAFNKESS
jgi:hypothetical protein